MCLLIFYSYKMKGSEKLISVTAGRLTYWNVTSAGWQVTLCEPIWYVSSGSVEAGCKWYNAFIYLLKD